jgi:hypothetical protein
MIRDFPWVLAHVAFWYNFVLRKRSLNVQQFQ